MKLVSFMLLVLAGCTAGVARAESPIVDTDVVSVSGVQAVRVLIQNTGHNCLPVWIDPTFSPVASPERPFINLKLEIQREDGTTVKPEPVLGSTWASPRPSDLLLLDCGEVFGRVINLSKTAGGWSYELDPGSYRVRACAQSDLEGYLATHPEWSEEFFRTIVGESRLERAAVREFSACSEWSQLQVEVTGQ